MSKFGSTQELHKRIGESLDRLKSGALEIQEFESLLAEARELYERLLILRFKAFENHISGTPLPATLDEKEKEENSSVIIDTVDDTAGQTGEQIKHIIPSDIEQLIIDDQEPAIEFALFGETSVDETPSFSIDHDNDKLEDTLATHEEQIVELTAEDIVTPDVPEFKAEISVTTTRVEVRVEEQKIQAGGSLHDQFSSGSQSNRLADQLKKSRIQSIASTLTLNDRIRFSKNLFNGNSETFNAAVQLFDAQKSMMESMELLREYSERFHWDQDDKTTMDFYELVERRHA
jgi:hypothetical protein